MFVFITFAPGGCAPFALPDKAKPMPTTYSGQMCQVLAFLSIKKLTRNAPTVKEMFDEIKK